MSLLFSRPYKIYHTGSPEAVHSPVHGGIAVFAKVPGSSTVGVGTLSGIVIDRTNRKKYLLSNQHVFYPVGPSKGGLSVYMTGDQSKPIAKTYRTKAESNPWPKEKKDEALATIGTYHDSAIATALVPVSMTYNNIGTQRGMITPKAGMRVKMFGRTSRLQRGVITKPDVNNINGNVAGGKIQVQKHVIYADMASAPGDSGSMVFNDDNRVIGLHFAKADSGANVICRASAIENAYNVVFSEDELGGAPPLPTPKPQPQPTPAPTIPPIQIPNTAEIIEFAKKNPLLVGAVGLGFIGIIVISATSK